MRCWGASLGTPPSLRQGGRQTTPLQDRLAASLISVMGRKSFLREAAANALVACLDSLPAGTLKHVLSSSEPLQAVLSRQPNEATPEVMSSSAPSLIT